MITATAGFMLNLYTSLRGIQVVGRVLGYVLPYSDMAAVKAKTNFNTKHLGKGDPLPPFNGKLRVYNMRYCPFAQRTMLTLIAKGIDYEIVNINLADKPEWLASKNVFTKVPVLEISDGVTIGESLVTVQYLDEVYPQRPLLPKDPVMKAKDKMISEAVGDIHSAFIKVLMAPEKLDEPTALVPFYRALDFIQGELQQRGSKFFGGSEPGYADYMIWPWFERFFTFDNTSVKIDEQKYKLLFAYIDNMSQDPVVVEYSLPVEAMRTLQSSYRNGVKPNYDLLLEN